MMSLSAQCILCTCMYIVHIFVGRKVDNFYISVQHQGVGVGGDVPPPAWSTKLKII